MSRVKKTILVDIVTKINFCPHSMSYKDRFLLFVSLQIPSKRILSTQSNQNFWKGGEGADPYEMHKTSLYEDRFV